MLQAADVLSHWLRALWGKFITCHTLACGSLSSAHMDPNGNASSLDWGDTAVNINYIPVAWHHVRIRDPSKMPVHILSGLYVWIYEAQDRSEAFKWHKATDETATQQPPSHLPAKAATPQGGQDHLPVSLKMHAYHVTPCGTFFSSTRY